MKVFITGATGFIGKRLTEKLIEQGVTVHALYRDKSKTLDLVHPNIFWFQGDLRDKDSIDTAMKGCRFVFHLAAFAKIWSKDKNISYNSIYKGTINILELAIKNQVEKVVVTSTAGVFGPSSEDECIDETKIRTTNYFSDYEKNKDITDKFIMENYTDKVNFCIVCPSRVYGPGELSDSNAVTKLIKLYHSGKFHFLPGNGKAVGNYVYIDDVVNGILLALKNGKRGERYILGGENISYLGFFNIISEITGKKYRLFKIPEVLLLFLARIMHAGSLLFRISPLFTPGWAKKYLHNWYLSNDKASTELGYSSVSLKTGIRKTLVWILSRKENKNYA